MKKLKKMIVITLSVALVLLSFPVDSLAGEKIQTIEVPKRVTDFVPPNSDISSDPYYSEGQTGSLSLMALASSTSVSGGCSISKNSATQVTITGYSFCTSSDGFAYIAGILRWILA